MRCCIRYDCFFAWTTSHVISQCQTRRAMTFMKWKHQNIGLSSRTVKVDVLTGAMACLHVMISAIPPNHLEQRASLNNRVDWLHTRRTLRMITIVYGLRQLPHPRPLKSRSEAVALSVGCTDAFGALSLSGLAAEAKVAAASRPRRDSSLENIFVATTT